MEVFVVKKIGKIFLGLAFALLLTGGLSSKAFAAEQNVAFMRIFASTGASAWNSGASLDGHAFLRFNNVGNSNITVGKLSIKPGTTVTVGTWGNKSEHSGIWYNLEAEFYQKYGAYKTNVSIGKYLTSTELASVNKFINNYNYWSISFPCSAFAAHVFNGVPAISPHYWPYVYGGLITGATTPTSLRNNLMGFGTWGQAPSSNYETNAGFYQWYPVYYDSGASGLKRSSQF